MRVCHVPSPAKQPGFGSHWDWIEKMPCAPVWVTGPRHFLISNTQIVTLSGQLVHQLVEQSYCLIASPMSLIMGWIWVPVPNSSVEAQIPNVTVFGYRVQKEAIKVKWDHHGGAGVLMRTGRNTSHLSPSTCIQKKGHRKIEQGGSRSQANKKSLSRS